MNTVLEKDKEFVREKDGVKYICYDSLEKTGLVLHGFMTRIGGVSGGVYGSLNLGFARGDDEEKVGENFARAAACFGLEPKDIVTGYQTHTANVIRVGKKDAGKGITRKRDYKDVDGLITNEAGVILATSHADCTPIFLLDPVNHAIGMVHSGWRGTKAMIGKKAVEAMTREFGSVPETIIAVIGPCICKKCYDVGTDTAGFFMGGEFGDSCVDFKADGKYLLDLKEANRHVLMGAGLNPENISVSDICTYEAEEFCFSHRRMGNNRGQNMAFICLKEEKPL